MSIVIYIWVALTLASCLFGFFLGRLPVFDTCTRRPWVVHRSYVPDPDHDSKAATRQFRRPPPDMTPGPRARG
jgi:hypothetical protein